MGRIFHLKQGQIYTADGEVYVAPRQGPRASVGIEYSKRPPSRLQHLIDRKVGLNPFDQPRWRVTWGWNRLAWVGGAFPVYDEQGRYRCERYGEFLEPAYSYLGANCNRWIVEKWFPAEAYGSRESWEIDTAEISGFEEVQALGPYPSRGDYELSYVLKDPLTEEFVQLTEGLVEMIIDVALQSMEIDDVKRQAFLEEQQRRQEAAFVNELTDMWDDARPAFGGGVNPNTTQANAPMWNTKKEKALL